MPAGAHFSGRSCRPTMKECYRQMITVLPSIARTGKPNSVIILRSGSGPDENTRTIRRHPLPT